MKSIFGSIVAISLAIGGAAGPAAAQDMPSQGFSLYGAWSGQLQSPKGVIAMTKSYNSNGSHVSRRPAFQRNDAALHRLVSGNDDRRNQLVVQNQPARPPTLFHVRPDAKPGPFQLCAE